MIIDHQDNISEAHFKEWHEQSKVHPDIIRLNVKSISGDNAYEHLLYGLDPQQSRQNNGRLRDPILRRYDHLNHGGWWCSGVNLLTFKDSDWGCFKPNQPKKDPSKWTKLIKYETPPGAHSEVFALKVSDKVWSKISTRFPSLGNPPLTGVEFWQEVIKSNVPIVITEGAKKAGAALTAGYATLALPGVNNGYKSEQQELIPHLQVLCKYGREIIFAFDADHRTRVRADVSNAIIRTGLALEQQGCTVSVMEWDHDEGKGLDDYLHKNGEGEFHEVFEKRKSLEKYIEAKGQPTRFKDKKHVAEWMDRNLEELVYNDLTKKVELNGKPLQMSGELGFYFAENYNIEIGDEWLIHGLNYSAKKRTYHPIKRYLDRCKTEVTQIPIDNLSTRYLGTTDPLYDIFVRRWLIAAVARIFEPGCKVDYALILQGAQGIGKSTFFNVLGGQWFDDSFGSNLESVKGLMSLYKCWIQEWAEFDRITSKNEFSLIKSFLTKRKDELVKPYGRESESFDRTFIFCGSINKDTFLKDETGDRRFLVVPVPSDHWIPTEVLEDERDAIWAAAVHEYLTGKKNKINAWNLTREEYQLLNQSNEQFRVTDDWEPMIEAYLQDKERTTVADILIDALDFEPSRIEHKQSLRIGSILRKLEWNKIGARKDSTGMRRQFWEKAINPVTVVTVGVTVKDQTVTDSNPHTASIPETSHSCHSLNDKLSPFNYRINSENNPKNPNPVTARDINYLNNPNNSSSTKISPLIMENIIKNTENKFAGFEPKQLVQWEGKIYQVERSSSTHVKLEGQLQTVPVHKCVLIEDVKAKGFNE